MIARTRTVFSGTPEHHQADLRTHLFNRQIQAAAKNLPAAHIANLICAAIVFFFAIPDSAGFFRQLWGGAALALTVYSVARWTPRRRRAAFPATRRTHRAILLEEAATGCLYTVLALVCYPAMDTAQTLVLTATLAGVIGAGCIALSPLRSAALVFLYGNAIGLAVALAISAGTSPTLSIVLLQLCVYVLVLTAGVMGLSTSFAQRCVAEFSATREHQLVTLLLDDFEGGARDWLWESAANGRISHVSARFAEVAGLSPEVIQDTTFLALIERLTGDRPVDPTSVRALDDLRSCFAQGRPFRAVVLNLHTSEGERWWSLSGSPRATPQGMAWSGVGADITDEHIQRMEIAHLASVDALTGLANRHQFNLEMDRLTRDEPHRPLAYAVLDLDDFKSINDSFGHHVGDAALTAIGRRIREAAGPDPLCVRLGGDEFAVLLRSRAAVENAGELFDRILMAVMQPLTLGDVFLDVAGSLGWARSPRDTTDFAELQVYADLTMQEAKQTGGRQALAFGPEVLARDSARAHTRHEIRAGVEEHQFEAWYQPQMSLTTDRPVSFEALARWRHPVQGLMMPADFIAEAERSGLIVPLGAQILRAACLDVVGWPEGFRVSVNVSVKQLVSPGYVASVMAVLEECGCPPDRLQIEITESCVADDSAVHTLRRLRDLGIDLALDDFGTGYSSLSVLRTLPLSAIKIPREFVRDLGQAGSEDTSALIAAILRLAHALHLDTIAEGVETEQQRSELARMGCPTYQGFLESAAMPADDVLGYLEHSRA